jgi:hypothetical protein
MGKLWWSLAAIRVFASSHRRPRQREDAKMRRRENAKTRNSFRVVDLHTHAHLELPFHGHSSSWKKRGKGAPRCLNGVFHTLVTCPECSSGHGISGSTRFVMLSDNFEHFEFEPVLAVAHCSRCATEMHIIIYTQIMKHVQCAAVNCITVLFNQTDGSLYHVR